MKKEKIDEKFRVIKRTISYIIFTISTFAHLILMLTNVQETIIADIIQMVILIPTSIIFFYINKTKKLGE